MNHHPSRATGRASCFAGASWAVAAAVLAASVPSASGQVVALLDNMSEAIRGLTEINSREGEAIWAAQGFNSDENTYSLVSIELILGEETGTPGAFAELRSGDDPSGPLLATLSFPPLLPSGVEIVTLVPDADVTIEPGVNYWITMGTLGDGGFLWSYAEGDAYAGTGTFYFYSYSEDLGGLWSLYGPENPYHVRVNVTLQTTECRPDCNGDGKLNINDFICFQAEWRARSAYGDYNGDGLWNINDFIAYQAEWRRGCP